MGPPPLLLLLVYEPVTSEPAIASVISDPIWFFQRPTQDAGDVGPEAFSVERAKPRADSWFMYVSLSETASLHRECEPEESLQQEVRDGGITINLDG